MSSPVALTEWLSAIGAVCAGAAAALTVRAQSRKDQRKDERDHDASDVASWSKLNASLDREIARLNTEMERQREDYERKLRDQQDRYERELALRDKRISELERDVDSLQRLLRGRDSS